MALLRLPPASKTHTFHSQSVVNQLPNGLNTIAELQQLIKSSYIPKTKRHELIDSKFDIVKFKDVEHVKYSVKILDKQANNSDTPLIMTFTGYICFHPANNKMALHYHYSERGTEKEINESHYKKDGGEFLNAIKITDF